MQDYLCACVCEKEIKTERHRERNRQRGRMTYKERKWAGVIKWKRREREKARERERQKERKREQQREKERERERCSLCRFRMTNRDWYLHVKSSTKYRYAQYKISDLSVRYSMFRHLHRIAHLSDVICAIPGCTQLEHRGQTQTKRFVC